MSPPVLRRVFRRCKEDPREDTRARFAPAALGYVWTAAAPGCIPIRAATVRERTLRPELRVAQRMDLKLMHHPRPRLHSLKLAAAALGCIGFDESGMIRAPHASEGRSPCPESTRSSPAASPSETAATSPQFRFARSPRNAVNRAASPAASAVWHSQMVSTVHPSRSNARPVRRSRALFRRSLATQYSRRDAGMRQRPHECMCQKQPRTSMILRRRG